MESVAHDPSDSLDSLAAPKVPLLQLVTRSGCHLCENAREVVATVAGQLQLRWTEVSLDEHPELTELYGEEVPVVLVNGIQRDFWHIDPIRLGTILSRALTGQ
ncbi:glutaredoxin family protein [Specibacter sp. NPDC078709]|uniref:glutaredoxin family protein n=1 Tax=unclassified Specibacter TaxID=3081321 RepID=UPI0034382B53